MTKRSGQQDKGIKQIVPQFRFKGVLCRLSGAVELCPGVKEEKRSRTGQCHRNPPPPPPPPQNHHHHTNKTTTPPPPHPHPSSYLFHVHRWQLKEITTENQLNAPKRQAWRLPDSTGNAVQFVQERCVNHGNFINDQTSAILPSLHGVVVVVHFVQQVCQRHTAVFDTGKRMNRRPTQMPRRQPRRGRHKDPSMHLILFFQLAHQFPQQITFATAGRTGKKHAFVGQGQFHHTALAFAEVVAF